MDSPVTIAEKTAKPMEGFKDKLLRKHYDRMMIGAERFILHWILKSQYKLGDIIPEYRCCSCDKPLMYTWEWGFRCLHMTGGCGRDFR